MKKNIYYLLTALLTMTLSIGSATARADGGFTRGIGVYPGRSVDYKGPDMAKSGEYRNVALNRAAYASSSIDYNLTAQLVTDGISCKGEPAMLDVLINGRRQGLRDKEKSIDGNVHSAVIVDGERASVQYDWTGMAVRLDTLRLLAEAVYYPDKAVNGYCIKVLASDDGRQWKEIGRQESRSLPGVATRQMVSSDPNKQEAAIRLPLRLVGTDIPLNASLLTSHSSLPTPHSYRHMRIELDMDGCAYWRLYEVDGGRYVASGDLSTAKGGRWISTNDSWLPSSRFTSAWVADSRIDSKPWLTVDLGAEADIDKIVLSWIHKPAVCNVQVSDDGKSWKDLRLTPDSEVRKTEAQKTEAWKSGHYIKHNLPTPDSSILTPNPTCCRYVRLTMAEPDASGLFALGEMQVWGKGGLVPVVAKSVGDGIGSWQLRRDGDNQWIAATVPGTVLTSYMNIGAVPDNRYANNMRQISESFFKSDFWYKANVKINALDKSRRTYLCFDGINWKAEVWLNGKQIGRIEGAFKRAKFDITAMLRKGDNRLEVKVLRNEHFGPVKVKNSESTDINGGVLGADNPTFHATIGWDWITSLPGREVGIWNDVYLAHDRGVSVADPVVTTKLSGDKRLADMTPAVMVKNYGAARKDVTVKGWIGGITFSKKVSLLPHEEKEVAFTPGEFPQLKGQEMRLWWPNGYGDPYLYDAGFSIEGDKEAVVNYKAGIREMSYETLDTDTKIFVNGKRLVPLGGNWGFSETNLNYRGREYDVAVRYHKEMNFNMIRNWVGQIGEEEFYDACDKYGIMVWQDFWLANPWDGPDPYNESMFLDNSEDLIKKIRRHPSIGIYVGRNEGYPPKTLDDSFRQQIKQLHPQLGYIPSSADDGVSGHGPYRMMDTKYYFDHQTGKLHSERGMPNVPSYESLKRMLAPDSLWPIGEAWGQHDFTLQGAQRGSSFCDIMEKRFGKPQGAEQFTEWAQWLDYEGYRAMYESSQQLRKGLVIWMSHSCWPSMVWCTYDYYFEPTAAYFGAKKACEPLHVQFNPSKREVEVVNIAAGNQRKVAVVAQVLDMRGNVLSEQKKDVTVGEDRTQSCMKIDSPKDSICFIRLRLEENGGVVSENFYVDAKTDESWRALAALPKADVEAKISVNPQASAHGSQHLSVTLTNKSGVPAMLIRLNLKGSDGEQILPVIYSDNYFHLMPGETKVVSVGYEREDGRGVKPVVDVSGFNLRQ